MLLKRNDVVVLFNPSIICIEQVLNFLKGSNDTGSKLHIISDPESEDQANKQKDLLILELTLPKRVRNHLFKYLDDLYPQLNKLIINKERVMETSAASSLLPIKESLKNRNYYLN